MAPTSVASRPPQATSAQEAIRRLNARYDMLIATRQYEPYVYPSAQFGFALVLIYLLIDHRRRPWLRRLALPVWLVAAGHSAFVMFTTRGAGSASSLGIGITTTWGILWAATILFNDGQSAFLRIVKRKPKSSAHKGIRIQQANGHNTPSTDAQPGEHVSEKTSLTSRPDGSKALYCWEPYPTAPFIRRLDWVVDLFTAFRGMAWNWRVPGLPPLPAYISSDLNDSTSDASSKTPAKQNTVRSYTTKSGVLKQNIFMFVRNYFILDVVKTLAAHDPWFWGHINTTTPPGYLPVVLHFPAAIRVARLLICLAAMKFALESIFCLGPIFFVGILGESRIGMRAEAWMHPDQFGPLSSVADRGLPAWWAIFWHQVFRKGFSDPGTALTTRLGIPPRSAAAKLTQGAVAFGLSAVLHACGSATQIGRSQPWKPFVFFCLQIAGIALQMGLVAILKNIGVTSRVPTWMGKVANFVYAHVWLYYTAPLLLEDFSQGGTFLFEPIPFSILRGPLRLGSEEDTFICWSGPFLKWHTGQHWWQSGLVF